MIHLQAAKPVAMLCDTATAAEAQTTDMLDTLGYDYVKFLVTQGAAAGSTAGNQHVAMEIQESDDTNASNLAVISAFQGSSTGAGKAFIIPIPVTAAGATYNTKLVEMNMDLRGRKRYLACSLLAGAVGEPVAVHAILTRAERVDPADTTAHNYSAIVVNG
jgi:hypothetical protein